MTDPYEYLEVELDKDDPAEAAEAIAAAMGIDMPLDSLEALLRRTRAVYREALGDWLRRNDPGWKAPRRLPRGKGPYDYGDLAGLGLPKWADWWVENWGRAQSNPRRFRGTDIATPPLVSIYFSVNRWWRDVMRLPFNPDFTGRYGGATDAARFDDLNRAAQIFLLVAQDACRNGRYNCDLCERVHLAYYRQLDRSFKTAD